MTRKILFFTFGFILLTKLSVAQQPLGFVLADGKKKVQIPFEVYNNLIVVPVVLNGMLPLRFIIDTGVQTGILTQKTFSDILNLPYSRKYTISGPGGEKIVEAYVTNNVSLELPGIHGRGHALLVLAQDYLELRNYLGTDVHGILGYELFSRFIIEINYQKKIMTVSLPGKYKPKRKYHRIPISVEDTKPYLHAQVELLNGTKVDAKLLVDTGASHGVLLESSSDKRIEVPPHTVSSLIGRGIGGEITGKVGRIESISLAHYTLKTPIANFPDANSYMDSLKMGKTARNGTIGGEILSRFTVVFNFSREEMFIKKNANFKKKFYYNLSGLTIKAKGSDLTTYEITGVRNNSVAEHADLRLGDLIVSINGIPTEIMTLNHVIAYFNSKPGKRVRLQINRNGELFRKEFILEDQI